MKITLDQAMRISESDDDIFVTEYDYDEVVAERNQAIVIIESLLEIGACVNRDDEIIENKRRREIARGFIKKLKEPKTNNV